MLYLIRHAEPLSHHRWQGDDETRPLSEHGRRQAAQVGAMLAESGATELLSAPHRRCVETAERIGEVLGLSVQIDRRLHIAKSFNLTEADYTRLWVAHSNNIPGALIRAGIPCHACGHASVWRVSFGPGEARADYVEPQA